ncbi:DUF6233 domain-containing protein [Streptomyces avidinii]|uniref:DUF6233 domain-containing protein n=1 Tax=Streptomyces avidinii TaxID=1895 RepID=UPI00386837DB
MRRGPRLRSRAACTRNPHPDPRTRRRGGPPRPPSLTRRCRAGRPPGQREGRRSPVADGRRGWGRAGRVRNVGHRRAAAPAARGGRPRSHSRPSPYPCLGAGPVGVAARRPHPRAPGHRPRRGLPECTDRAHPLGTMQALDVLARPGTTACSVCGAAEALLPILAHGQDDVPSPGNRPQISTCFRSSKRGSGVGVEACCGGEAEPYRFRCRWEGPSRAFRSLRRCAGRGRW